MHETAAAILHIDPPYPGLVGGAIVHGWLVPKPGRHYTELRARAGDRIFPGVFGFPRTDLAAFFKADRPYLPAGFAITLTLPAGPHPVILEALTLAGNWERIDEIVREVTAGEARPAPNDQAPVDAGAFGEMLRILLRAETMRAADAAALVARTPERHHLQHPPRPLHGHLDQPRIWSRAVFGRLPVTGWIYHESLAIRRVFATTDLLAAQDLKFGRATDFLLGRSPASAQLGHCGYDGFLDVPSQLPGPVTVRVYVELADGTCHLGSVARFAATDHEFAKQSPAAFSPVRFLRTVLTLAGAIRARGWPLPWAGARAVLRNAWRDYAREAPRAHASPAPAKVGLKSGAPRLHLFTHNLSQEGAPLFLLEYAEYLRRVTGSVLAVTSAGEGPLRGRFEALGATVTVVDPRRLAETRTADDCERALAALAAQVDLQPGTLVIANTLSCYWGVLLARRANCPALFYIHESTTPRAFFRGTLPGPALAAMESAFALAERVSFLTASTQRYYTGWSPGTNYRLNPGWIDLAAIDHFRRGHSRADLRNQLGLPDSHQLVINVGTVCERKGQHIFARAVEWLWRAAPAVAARADFLMIGARDTAYDRELADFIARLGRPNLRLVPETPDVYSYYGAADVFACSSYEESFPRVLLEAMAFRLPIVSTAVHGIPEMVRADHEAMLVPAGDSAALADGLHRLLTSPSLAGELANRARERVAGFDSRVLLPRHLALARELAPALGTGLTSP